MSETFDDSVIARYCYTDLSVANHNHLTQSDVPWSETHPGNRSIAVANLRVWTMLPNFLLYKSA